jgi:hypothetical protein
MMIKNKVTYKSINHLLHFLTFLDKSTFQMSTKLTLRFDDQDRDKTEGKRLKREDLLKDELVSNLNIPINNAIDKFSSTWTAKEEQLLMKLCNQAKMRKKWANIAQIIGTKTPNQCSYRYRKLAGVKKGKGKNSSQNTSEKNSVSEGGFSEGDMMLLTSTDNNITHITNTNGFPTGISSSKISTESGPRIRFIQSHSTIDSKNDDILKVTKPSFVNDNNLDFPQILPEGLNKMSSYEAEKLTRGK